MEKTKINALIVVEGKTDIDFLSSFIEADFYKVNGSAVEKSDFDFINTILKKKKVIILTDPDFPGIQIRNKIRENCPGVYDAFIRKEKSIKKNKVGVAESTKEEILSSLKNYKNFNIDINKSDLKLSDLIELNLIGTNSKVLRNKICDFYHIGYSNGKNLLKKLLMLDINKCDLLKAIDYVEKRGN